MTSPARHSVNGSSSKHKANDGHGPKASNKQHSQELAVEKGTSGQEISKVMSESLSMPTQLLGIGSQFDHIVHRTRYPTTLEDPEHHAVPVLSGPYHEDRTTLNHPDEVRDKSRGSKNANESRYGLAAGSESNPDRCANTSSGSTAKAAPEDARQRLQGECSKQRKSTKGNTKDTGRYE